MEVPFEPLSIVELPTGNKILPPIAIEEGTPVFESLVFILPL
jgi:hypothetical protein